MADEVETKEKKTVPGLVRTAKGIAEHAAIVREQQWDKDRKVMRDPFIVALALFKYAELTAALLDETEERFRQAHAALVIRTERLEQQIAAFEAWRAEAQRQADEMVKGMSEMMEGGGEPLDHFQKLLPTPPTATIIDASPTPETKAEAPATVVQLKPENIDKKRGEKREKGGAA